MREITIKLPYEVAHRLEVMAARDDDRIETGIEALLTYLTEQFDAKRVVAA
jgi:hypothetical protein